MKTLSLVALLLILLAAPVAAQGAECNNMPAPGPLPVVLLGMGALGVGAAARSRRRKRRNASRSLTGRSQD